MKKNMKFTPRFIQRSLKFKDKKHLENLKSRNEWKKKNFVRV